MSFTGKHYHECATGIFAWPGEVGFCFGFISPLMVFFDDARPKFLGKSMFPLHPKAELVAWPEKNAPGWFLAHDTYGNGKILSGKQLFRESAYHKNGFEDLRRYDSNKDNVIDKKDKEFSKLVLWKDKNGDGISQKSKKKKLNEVVKLKDMGIVSISLKYVDNHTHFVNFGNRAQARQYAEFKFKKKSKVKTGKIIDIWFRDLNNSVAQTR